MLFSVFFPMQRNCPLLDVTLIDHEAPVAQLDRAPPSEGGGHTFESCRVRHAPICYRAAGRLAGPRSSPSPSRTSRTCEKKYGQVAAFNQIADTAAMLARSQRDHSAVALTRLGARFYRF